MGSRATATSLDSTCTVSHTIITDEETVFRDLRDLAQRETLWHRRYYQENKTKMDAIRRELERPEFSPFMHSECKHFLSDFQFCFLRPSYFATYDKFLPLDEIDPIHVARKSPATLRICVTSMGDKRAPGPIGMAVSRASTKACC